MKRNNPIKSILNSDGLVSKMMKPYFDSRERFNTIRHEMIDIVKKMFPEQSEEFLPEVFGGSLKSYDAFMLEKIIRDIEPKKVLEIGSFLGLSTRWILNCTEEYKTRVISVDPNIPHRVFDEPRKVFMEFAAKKYRSRLEIVNAFFSDGSLQNDYTRMYPDTSIHWAPPQNEKFDLIFIDAGHSYEDALHDFLLARKYLTERGVIVFHDTESWDGVKRLMNEIKADMKTPLLYLLFKNWFINNGYLIDGIGCFYSERMKSFD